MAPGFQPLADKRRKVVRAFHRLITPISPDRLRSSLNTVTGGRAEILMVHTSLSQCGRFTAGPADVLGALDEFCSTLAFPAHTFSYPSVPGEPGPLFDAATTPSQSGLLTEMFRTGNGVSRSIQATHSLAARGPLAADITCGHYRSDTPCGAGTPYSRLVERRASVLMFGVTFHSYTLFHTAEDASGSEYAYEEGTIDRLRVIDEHGVVRDCLTRRQTRKPRRFKEAGDLLQQKGLIRRCELGKGALLFVPDCSSVHEFLVERLRMTPDFLYQSCRNPLA